MAALVCKAGLKINHSFPGFWAGPRLEEQVPQPSFTPRTCLQVFAGHTGLGGGGILPSGVLELALTTRESNRVHLSSALRSMSLVSAPVEAFTPWKSANTVNQGFPLFFLPESELLNIYQHVTRFVPEIRLKVLGSWS